MKNLHEFYEHISFKHTLTELKQRFRIVRRKNFVREFVTKCLLVCKRFEGKTYRYSITTSLTPLRLNDSRPFVTTGIDNFEPVYVKNVYGQSDKTYKTWVTLYTCATSRAIILDLTPGMDPSVLKRRMKRFTSRRGCPSILLVTMPKISYHRKPGNL